MLPANPTPIFHITSLENLPTIISEGGLLSTSAQSATKVSAVSIAHQDIQGRRSRYQVPCGARGVLHDYVPFYFCPRSPMLFAIHKGYVKGYDRGQEEIVHLRSSAQRVATLGLTFAFTDGHAIMRYSEYYEDLSKLGEVDWNVVQSNSWADSERDPDRKRRKQAEFLVHHSFPWEAVEEIGVANQAVAKRVRTELAAASHVPKVVVYDSWYYR